MITVLNNNLWGIMLRRILILILSVITITGCTVLNSNLKKGTNKNPDLSLTVNQPSKNKKNKEQEINKTIESSENPSVSSIPEKNKTDINSKVPSLNPKAPILSRHEAVEQIRELYIGDLKPVTSKSKPLLILYDISGDGQPEVFSLAVAVKEPKRADASFLADYSRLFSENKMPVHFYLLLYGNNSGKLYILNRIDLGSKYVYRSFKHLTLSSKDPKLAIISVGFQTEDGLKRKWLIFKGPDLRLLSTFTLRENLSIKTEVSDIDDNGIIDIVVQETGIEEGTGYETFLTWYRWNGFRFAEYKNTNIVRNLKAFLTQVKYLLEQGKTKELLKYALERRYIAAGIRKKMDTDTILFNSLGFNAFFDSITTKPASVLKNIRDVTFPNILENPFSLKDKYGWYFKPSYRVTIKSGLSFIAETEVRMFKNPFGRRQFSLTLPK